MKSIRTRLGRAIYRHILLELAQKLTNFWRFDCDSQKNLVVIIFHRLINILKLHLQLFSASFGYFHGFSNLA